MFLRGARVAPMYQQGTQKNCVLEFRILSSLKLGSCEPVEFIDMNTDILTESWNFKIFLKDNYAVTLGSCYILWNVELNMMLIVLMVFVYIRHS